MPNDYFSFRHFTIHQSGAALKVCTDASLFGAWLTEAIRPIDLQIKHALDIGTGTGLISLQLAQQLSARVDAVEIDEKSAKLAKQNVMSSSWLDRINIITADILQFQPKNQYDLILSNPPFFSNDLKPLYQENLLAKHEQGLTVSRILEYADEWSTTNAYLGLLLPANREQEILSTSAKTSWRLVKYAAVQQTEKHPPFRIFLLFGKGGSEASWSQKKENIVIRNAGYYSDRFATLMEPFYLPSYHLRNMK